jgi:hypothetical protein
VILATVAVMAHITTMVGPVVANARLKAQRVNTARTVICVVEVLGTPPIGFYKRRMLAVRKNAIQMELAVFLVKAATTAVMVHTTGMVMYVVVNA